MNTQTESKTTLPVFKVQERAILYARVSGDDAKNSTSSIAGQFELGREYANKKDSENSAEFFAFE